MSKRGRGSDHEHQRVYYSRYDRFACRVCDKWLERVPCCDGNCDGGFSQAWEADGRPARPSEAKAKWEVFE